MMVCKYPVSRAFHFHPDFHEVLESDSALCKYPVSRAFHFHYNADLAKLDKADCVNTQFLGLSIFTCQQGKMR